MPTKKPRVTFTISEEQLALVEDFQFSNKIKNQTQAILQLLERGLEDIAENPPVFDAIGNAPSLSDEAKTMLPLFEQLERQDKYRIIGQVEGLLMQEKYEQAGGESAG